MIFESIGRPPEHIKEALENLVNEIDKEKSVKVTSRKINEPILMKDQKDFYTTFAEVEVEVDDVLNELARRLHAYDEVTRVTQVEKNILEKKLRELLNEKKGK